MGGIILILFHDRPIKSEPNSFTVAPGSSVSANFDKRMRSSNPSDFFINILSYNLLWNSSVFVFSVYSLKYLSNRQPETDIIFYEPFHPNVKYKFFFFIGWTALHEASVEDFYEIANELLKAGADVDARGGEQVTPLQDAVKEGHYEVYSKLNTNYGLGVEIIVAWSRRSHNLFTGDWSFQIMDKFRSLQVLLAQFPFKPFHALQDLSKSRNYFFLTVSENGWSTEE